MNEPDAVELSVVVAANNAVRSVEACLDSLRRQVDPGRVEIIVVDNSTDGTTERIPGGVPNLRHLRAAPDAWINELWSEGLAQCRGATVALTTAHCVPAADWLQRIREALAGPHAAVGGVIAKATPASVTDWAIYFCRYSAHLPSVGRAEVDDLAADNAAYRHAILRRYAPLYASGFWEPVIHSRMVADGHTLLRDPRLVVSYASAFGLRGFVRQRFHHGRIFARVRRLPARQRLARAAGAPLVPVVMAWRIARRVRRAPAERQRFLPALPLVLVFLAAWSLGEMAGYLSTLADDFANRSRRIPLPPGEVR